MEDHTTLFTDRIAFSLMWKESYWVCAYVCVYVFCYYKCGCPLNRTREAAVIFTSNYTLGTPLLRVHVCVHSHTFFVIFVCNSMTLLFVCVCVCVRVCAHVSIPHKALGLQAAWWRCRWDNIWHVSDLVSVCVPVCVCKCLCVCVSVHLGSPLIGRGSLCSLWPTGEVAGGG